MTDRRGMLLAGRYRVESLVAVGGSASVWVAEQLALRRPVIAKFHEAFEGSRGASTDPHASTALARFMREARLLSSVRHRNVIQLYEVGKTEAGEPYLILEPLRGQSLAERLARESALEIDSALGIAEALAEGLEVVHAAGVIHRDVKPENVMLHEPDPPGEVTPKLLDFGLARKADPAARLTSVGAAIGTPGYMAPEQARGQDLDPRADLFSLGVTLYELLSGELPFEGDSSAELLAANAEREPIPISTWGADLAGRIGEVVMKALARERDERYANAREMRHAIAALRPSRKKGPPRAQRPTPPRVPVASFPPRRSPSEPRHPAGHDTPPPKR